jgi:hypothetical protein
LGLGLEGLGMVSVLVLRLKSGNFQDLDLPTFLLNYVTETNYLASFIKKCLLLSVAKGSRRLDSWRRRGPIPASLEAEAPQEPGAEPNRHFEELKTLVA